MVVTGTEQRVYGTLLISGDKFIIVRRKYPWSTVPDNSGYIELWNTQPKLLKRLRISVESPNINIYGICTIDENYNTIYVLQDYKITKYITNENEWIQDTVVSLPNASFYDLIQYDLSSKKILRIMNDHYDLWDEDLNFIDTFESPIQNTYNNVSRFIGVARRGYIIGSYRTLSVSGVLSYYNYYSMKVGEPDIYSSTQTYVGQFDPGSVTSSYGNVGSSWLCNDGSMCCWFEVILAGSTNKLYQVVKGHPNTTLTKYGLSQLNQSNIVFNSNENLYTVGYDADDDTYSSSILQTDFITYDFENYDTSKLQLPRGDITEYLKSVGINPEDSVIQPQIRSINITINDYLCVTVQYIIEKTIDWFIPISVFYVFTLDPSQNFNKLKNEFICYNTDGNYVTCRAGDCTGIHLHRQSIGSAITSICCTYI